MEDYKITFILIRLSDLIQRTTWCEPLAMNSGGTNCFFHLLFDIGEDGASSSSEEKDQTHLFVM